MIILWREDFKIRELKKKDKGVEIEFCYFRYVKSGEASLRKWYLSSDWNEIVSHMGFTGEEVSHVAV